MNLSTARAFVLILALNMLLIFSPVAGAVMAGIRSLGAITLGRGYALGGFPYGSDPTISRDSVYIAGKTTSTQVLWKSEIAVQHMTVSPDGRYIAFIEGLVTLEDGTRAFSVLRILDSNGKPLKTLPGIYDYDWSPEGNALVAVKGSYREGGYGFDMQGVSIISIDGDEDIKIFDCGRAVAWARFDGNIYIYNPGRSPVVVLRYDLRHSVMSETALLGIHFSSKGTYYHTEDMEFRIFRAADNADVSASASNLPRGSDLCEPIGWLDDRHLILGFVEVGNTRCHIYDAQEDILRMAPGPAVMTDTPGILAMWDSGAIRNVALSELPVLNVAGMNAP